MKTLDQQILACLTTRLMEQFPALSPALSLLSFQETQEKAAGTDGRSFYYEKNSLREAFLQDRLDFLFLHTLTHVLFLHFLPEKDVDPSIWDLAADAAASFFVDTYLLSDSPGFSERKKQYAHLPANGNSAEKLYCFFLEKSPKERESFSLFRADDHRYWYDSAFSIRETSLSNGNASDQALETPSEEGLSGPSSSNTGKQQHPFLPEKTVPDHREQLSRIKKALEFLSLSSLSPSRKGKSHRGTAPGSRLEWLLLEKKGSYDFRRYLRRLTITREETKADLDSFDYIPYCYGLSRPEKLLFLEPLEYRDSAKIQDLVIAIDTSGSCSSETVSRFLSETLNILSSREHFFERMNVHLIQCDSAIQSHTVIHSADEWKECSKEIQILGRGGTDFTPVFSYINDLQKKGELTQLKGLLYFTDGDGIYPSSPPPYETAFVFTDFSFLNYPVPSFITKLCLDTNQAGNEVFQYEH